MKWIFSLLIILPNIIQAQIITTVAGNDTSGYGGDGGLAIKANLNSPCHAITDVSGNIYIADYVNNRIRKVDTAGIITTIAGNGTGIHGGDGGLATMAGIDGPQGIAIDRNGNLYIAEDSVGGIGKPYVRKVNAAGIITTIAGNGTALFSGDGEPAIDAGLTPVDIAIDKAGNIYIADFWNNRIRKIDSSGIITTIAGNGIAGFSGDSGLATIAHIYNPYSIAVDNIGNVYIADGGNNRIRKVDTNGIITTIAGSGTSAFSGDGEPAINAGFSAYGVAVDSLGNIYIADAANERIRKVNAGGIINSIAGDGIYSHNGDGGPAASAALYDPVGVAIDIPGNVYITEYVGATIRKVSISATATTIPGLPDNDVYIYPNPTTISLNLYAKDGITSVVIFNLLSQTIYTHNYHAEKVQIDISPLPAGIYFIKINGTEVRKFVKE